MTVLSFNNWISENSRPTRKVTDLDTNRRYKDTRYEYELYQRFKRLIPRINQLPKKPDLNEWFIMMQNSDNEFYTLVITGALGQPDVRELWRDLTGRRSARMKKYNIDQHGK
ncbi:MAG: hypothetical protein WC123_03655 [Bacilli bacterium]